MVLITRGGPISSISYYRPGLRCYVSFLKQKIDSSNKLKKRGCLLSSLLFFSPLHHSSIHGVGYKKQCTSLEASAFSGGLIPCRLALGRTNHKIWFSLIKKLVMVVKAQMHFLSTAISLFYVFSSLCF